jgi:hypothetical protein
MPACLLARLHGQKAAPTTLFLISSSLKAGKQVYNTYTNLARLCEASIVSAVLDLFFFFSSGVDVLRVILIHFFLFFFIVIITACRC